MLFVHRGLSVCIVLGLLLLASARVTAQDDSPSRSRHLWGSFKVGSWKRLRKLTETLDGDGKIVSTSSAETTVTLTNVNDMCFTRRSEVKLEVAGKVFQAEPRIFEAGYFGQAVNAKVHELDKQRSGKFFIDGRSFETQIRTFNVRDDASSNQIEQYYSEELFPHVLRSATKTLGANGEPGESTSVSTVIAVNMPYKVLTETKLAWYLKTIRQVTNGKEVTLEIYCEDIPGGLVAHTSKMIDANGRVMERSTLELLDYGIGDGTIQSSTARRRAGLFRRQSR